jgi:RNA polymerase sigma-70 factor, ECF subfamily
MNERSAIERAKSGDLHAFGELLRMHQSDAQRLAYVILRHPSDAEDAVQEAFVKVWRSLARFDTARSFRPWLLKIVANEARMRRRSSGQRQRLQLRLESGYHMQASIVESPEVVTLELDYMERILHEMENLPEQDEVVLKLRFFLGMSTGEIADILEVPAGTIRSRLSRAIQKLRERVIDDVPRESADTSIWKRPGNDPTST